MPSVACRALAMSHTGTGPVIATHPTPPQTPSLPPSLTHCAVTHYVKPICVKQRRQSASAQGGGLRLGIRAMLMAQAVSAWLMNPLTHT